MFKKALLLSSIIFFTGCVERGYDLTIDKTTQTVTAIKTVDIHTETKKTSTQKDIQKMNIAIKKIQKKKAQNSISDIETKKIKKQDKEVKEQAKQKQEAKLQKEKELQIEKENKLQAKSERAALEKKIAEEKEAKRIAAENERKELAKKKKEADKLAKEEEAKRLAAIKEKSEKEALKQKIAKEKAERERKEKAEKLALERKLAKAKELQEAKEKKEKEALEAKIAQKKKEQEERKKALRKQQEAQKLLKEKEAKAAKLQTMQENNARKKVTTAESLIFKPTKQTYQKFGTSEIHGHVVYMTQDGQEIALKNTKIYLVPKNTKVDYWYTNYYLKNKESSSLSKTVVHYLNATHLNLEKNFAFYGLATGTYYIIIESDYPSKTLKDKKVYIAKKISVEKYKKIMTVFSKKL